MNDKEYMTCPNHGDEIVRLHEVEDEDDAMECLRCDFVCPNFLKNQSPRSTTTQQRALFEKCVDWRESLK